MKKFSELKVGDEFFSECKISLSELESYLAFSKIKNAIYENNENMKKETNTMISGRAILGRIEGEFTRLKEMYGNLLIFYGMDGEPEWKNRHTRFLKPLYTNENLKIKFKISEKTDLNESYGLLAIDFEGSKDNGELVVVSKRNLYQIKKELSENQQKA
ncbi:MAG: hypothetical protein D4R72_03425 [Nitrosopumilales archaeon]|nr:MAG: hypothetical protein D4R72_03425 [Nitrosopumilales archaeon]